MANVPKPSPESPQGAGTQLIRVIPAAFNYSVIGTFFWIVFGLSFIYGYRAWWDAPIDPSFVPFICVGFSVVVSFAIVMTLSYANGDIEFEAPGFKFKGASGPIVMWAVCFSALIFGFYLIGAVDAAKVDNHQRIPLPRVHLTPPKPTTLPTPPGPNIIPPAFLHLS